MAAGLTRLLFFYKFNSKHFLKWRERHVVRFGFQKLHDKKSPPTLWFPLPYSTQIHAEESVEMGALSFVPSGTSSESGESGSVDEVALDATSPKVLPSAGESSYHFPTKISTETEGEIEIFEWYCLTTKVK